MSLKISNEKFHDRLEKNMEDDYMQIAMIRAQNHINGNRKRVYAELGHFEEWRGLSEEIRQHTLENLDYYLHQFSENVVKQGGKVFFAETPEEANAYIQKIAKEKDAKKVVKAKSMVTEEIGLNHALEEIGVKVVETDLAEFILQTDDCDPPSHMVVPSLHKTKEKVRDVFHDKLGYDKSEAPEELAQFAREQLRDEYMSAEIGVAGCNFAIAESGSISLVTNEGNADLVMSCPKTQIVVMGMERIVPTYEEADILISLLCRSAVGAKLTSYITFLTGVTEEGSIDGPDDFHVVIIDNGRSKILESEFKSILQCIRCAACLNICPVYRKIGGHSYGSIYSGPVGCVLTPLLGGYDDFKDLPYACSLCGACTEICPAGIPLHSLIHRHREVICDEERRSPVIERAIMKGFTLWAANPWFYRMSTNMLPLMSKPLTKDGKISTGFSLMKKWTDKRDLPAFEKERFRDWFEKREEAKSK